MKHYFVFFILLGGFFLMDQTAFGQAESTSYFVRLRSTNPTSIGNVQGKVLSNARPALSILSEIQFKNVRQHPAADRLLRTYIVSTSTPHLLRKNALVELVEPVPTFDLLNVPDDPAWATNQAYLNSIFAQDAWTSGGIGDASVVIAIIDTGTDIDHEDLRDNVYINPNEIPDNGVDDDNNGFIDDIHGWDFSGQDNDIRPGSSSNAHGTHVAGIAAATTNNSIGVSSLSWNVRYLPIKISDDSGSNLRNGFEAIEYAIAMGVDVINCSWGSTQYSQTFDDLITLAAESNVLVVGAAGNANNAFTYYPAGYTRALSVGSVDYVSRTKASYSSFGHALDVMAPGGETNENAIYSTLPNNSYGLSFGTSMAAPVVSALAGLLQSVHPDWDKAQIRAQIIGTAQELAVQETRKSQLGSGMIHAANAVGTPVPLLELESWTFQGKSQLDAIFTRNELIRLTPTFRSNGSASTNVTVSLNSLSEYISIQSSNFSPLSIEHNEVFSLPQIELIVRGDTPVNTEALLEFEFTYPNGQKSYQRIPLRLVPDFGTHNNSGILLSLDGYGHIGSLDYPNNSRGNRFEIDSPSTTSLTPYLNTPLLFEGGLLYGNSASRISSSIRGVNNSVDDEFFLIDFFESSFTPQSQEIRGRSAFTDLNAGIDGIRYDITTTLSSYSFGQEEERGYILLEYSFTNDSDESYANFHAGLFFDFDLPQNQADDNVVFYDEDRDIIAQYNSSVNGEDDTLFVGVSVVEGIHTPWLIENRATSSFYFGIHYDPSNVTTHNGFADAEKWQALSLREAAVISSRQELGPADVSFVVTPRPFNLSPDQSQKQVFVTAYGVGYQELVSRIERGKTKSKELLLASEIEPDEPTLPSQFRVHPAFPNPFNPSTTLTIETSVATTLTIDLIDILGRVQLSLPTKKLQRGTHSVGINGNQLSTGVYFVRVRSASEQQFQKIMLIK